MIEYNNFEKAIIVSNDGDFHCLIEYLELNNKLLKILVPNRKYSKLLNKFERYIIRLDLIQILFKKEKTKISNRSKP